MIVDILLCAGANQYLKDKNGITAKDHAILHEFHGVALRLTEPPTNNEKVAAVKVVVRTRKKLELDPVLQGGVISQEADSSEKMLARLKLRM